jgi:hypothetical protein
MDTLTAADCDYLQQLLVERAIMNSDVGRVSYEEQLIRKLHQLENDLNWVNSPDGQVIRN